MAIDTEFDNPPAKEIRCAGCGEIMTVEPFWTGRIWVYPTAHEECSEKQYAVNVIRKRQVPDRFKRFEHALFGDAEALEVVQSFNPTCGFRTLALIGLRGRGKSRLMWYAIGRFFEEFEKQTKREKWVHYWLFSDLITEFDRHELTKVKTAEFCFIDDIRSVENSREKSHLQDVIRARVQKNHWTFLTIDDPSFDPGFKDLFRQRAVEVYVE